MKKLKIQGLSCCLYRYNFIILVSGLLFFSPALSAQEEDKGPVPIEAGQEAAEAPYEVKIEAPEAPAESLNSNQMVTLDFKDADIRNVLKIISYKSGVNIVTTPEVMGNISIRLVDVPWEKALDVILKTYGFGYEKQANIINVAPIGKLTDQKKLEVELAQVQPTVTEVFNLKYIDAQDAKKALEPQLSVRGKITVLEMTGQAGWEFAQIRTEGSSEETTKLKRVTKEASGRSRVLIISDVPPVMDKIREVVAQIDIMPQQVLIEARIMEVSRDKLKDIGFDWGTGTGGAESTGVSMLPYRELVGRDLSQIGGRLLGNQIIPSVFGPKESTLTSTNTGLKVLFKKLTGAQFEILLHALDEDVHTNTLSAPRVMTLNNQEATILVGTKYPILKTEVSGENANTTTTLDFYQDIGIQLNVVPQIGANNSITMVVHPVISSIVSTDNAIASANYPVIDIREAETRVLMKDGETTVIGGLLKDVKNRETIGIPFLSKIPLFGFFFRRETIDTAKVDLLIFVTARIIKEGEYSPEEIARLKEGLGKDAKKFKVKNKKR